MLYYIVLYFFGYKLQCKIIDTEPRKYIAIVIETMTGPLDFNAVGGKYEGTPRIMQGIPNKFF